LQKADFKKDLVYLVQFTRAKCVPSTSPFCLKVETYLRMADIDYENISELSKASSKGQKPFIELNGEQVADSTFIIDHLAKRFNKDKMEANLSPLEKATAYAFERMIEDALFWQMLHMRSKDVYTSTLGPESMGPGLPAYVRYGSSIIAPLFARKLNTKLFHQGAGRNTVEENTQLAMKNLRAFSTYLGTKKYMCGDNVTRYDAAAFGHLSQLYFTPMVTPVITFLKEDKECANIGEYLKRIKSTFWPDWTDVCDNLRIDTKWK